MKAAERSLYYVIIAVLALLLLLARSCGKPKPCPDQTVSITKIDTVYVPVKDTILSKRLVPTAILHYDATTKTKVAIPSNPLPRLNINRTDSIKVPIFDLDYISGDSIRFYNSYVYNDTIKLKYGNVYVIDTITQNVPSRTVITDLRQPVINEQRTTACTPHNQLYVGLDVLGSVKRPISMFGPQLLFKNKREQIFTVGAVTEQFKELTLNTVTWKVGTYYKIRFKRNQ